MSEPVSSTPAIPPGRAWSSNHHRWRQSRPTFTAERTQNQSASSAHWDTFEKVVDTEDEDNDDTIDLGDLQEYARDELEVLATCMDNGENDAPIPSVDNSHLETACLKLAELPKPLPSFEQPGGEPQTKTDVLVLLLAARANLDTQLDDYVCPTVRVISDRTMTDQLRSSEELNDLGHSVNNEEARICKQSWTNEKHAASVMRVVRPDFGQVILNAQVVLSM